MLDCYLLAPNNGLQYSRVLNRLVRDIADNPYVQVCSGVSKVFMIPSLAAYDQQLPKGQEYSGLLLRGDVPTLYPLATVSFRPWRRRLADKPSPRWLSSATIGWCERSRWR